MFACVDLYDEATRPIAAQMPGNLIEAVPYGIHGVLTDNRQAIFRRMSATPTRASTGQARRPTACTASTGLAWPTASSTGLPSQPSLDQRPGRANEPHHRTSADEPEQHLHAVLLACTCARRLRTLKGSTPYDSTCCQ